MDFKELELLTIDELLLFKQKCSDNLYELQESGDNEKIQHWSELQSMCISLIRRKKNE